MNGAAHGASATKAQLVAVDMVVRDLRKIDTKLLKALPKEAKIVLLTDWLLGLGLSSDQLEALGNRLGRIAWEMDRNMPEISDSETPFMDAMYGPGWNKRDG